MAGTVMSTQQSTDVVIIGAGVIGCSIAYFLRKAGVAVTVVERAEIASEASGAAGGMISQLGGLGGSAPFLKLMLASWSLYSTLIPELQEISGVDVEYRLVGCLRAVFKEEAVEPLRRQVAACSSVGIDMRWLTGDEGRSLAPYLAPDALAVAYAPQVASIKPPLITRAYALAAQRAGALFKEQTEVTGITRSGDTVTAVHTATSETISCAQLIIAAGTWSASCGEWLNLTIPVAPAKGQILALKQPKHPLEQALSLDAPGAPMQHDLIGGVYLIPKADGSIYVGSTVEHGIFGKQPTAGGIHALLASALYLAPALKDAAVLKLWSGLRPWSADGYPILGRAPGWENVILATGHCGIGFEGSAITGQTIAELVTTGQTPELLRPFGLERFAAKGQSKS